MGRVQLRAITAQSRPSCYKLHASLFELPWLFLFGSESKSSEVKRTGFGEGKQSGEELSLWGRHSHTSARTQMNHFGGSDGSALAVSPVFGSDSALVRDVTCSEGNLLPIVLSHTNSLLT